jgi:hypothetical protein
MGKASLDLLVRMHDRVYRLLKEARERGIIPWSWIVDESRDLEIAPSWNDPDNFADCAVSCYRRDFWNQQPVRIEVWSEKGTVRGVLAPVLDEYAVGFRVLHGFSGARTVHDVAQTDEPLTILYVGDYDPPGLFMSKRDLPDRLRRYGGNHIALERIALAKHDVSGLPSFPAKDKTKDPRYRWFVKNYGRHCWELDAMDPNDLRSRVEDQITRRIDMEAWQRCRIVQEAERESMRLVRKVGRRMTV